MKKFTTIVEDFVIESPVGVTVGGVGILFEKCEVDFEINQDLLITEIISISIRLKSGIGESLNGGDILFSALKTHLTVAILNQKNFKEVCMDALRSAQEE